ncbi:uncharacterized protein LOC124919987 isoform X2 [Impatiens glandulifera]|uniref:uncharacterized protein LOC124919987 isoform X2 n=1 Tax=Impatiens glandulifera TaxID=253017 RepID=UPI001FB05C98|nr:uncharacterized protein LOC124919987 isoform X2 [Impatiens glandulifera]
MKKAVAIFFFSFIFLCQRVFADRASFPPRGWNSYDSFCWTISEEEFLENAALVSQKLKAHGYEYVVLDYLWYRKKINGAYTDSEGFDVIDEWGRMMPDPNRWPSSKDGKGLSEVAKNVHNMGLKFGIHVMRGLSKQAFNANTPILDIDKGSAYVEDGRIWYAKDIGLTERACAWMSHGFMSVNTKLGAGRAFLRSLYLQYADWGIDFVKHDCVFGDDLDIDEISTVSEVLRGLKRPILYSLSPGTSVTPAMAKRVNCLVNMYRITGDDWDTWLDVASHFNITRDFSAANMTGAAGLLGKSWPDLDMLPLGWLTDPGSNEGPHRNGRLTLNEQRTQMTLWSMSRSPLMFGGDMRKLDKNTLALITHPTLLEINSFSSNNMEFPYVTASISIQFGDQSMENTNLGERRVFSLSSCTNVDAKSWTSKSLDDDTLRVCWNDGGSSGDEEAFCLYRRNPDMEFEDDDEKVMMKERLEGKMQLLARNQMDMCLNASPRRRLYSKEIGRGSFSPCKWDANQMWELNYDGTLRNNYSGQCASMRTIKVKATAAAVGGIRSWIATGRDGKIYLAYFNLNSEKTVMSTKVSEVIKAVGLSNINGGGCFGKEVWSGSNIGPKEESISAFVESHGSALFVLNCG